MAHDTGMWALPLSHPFRFWWSDFTVVDCGLPVQNDLVHGWGLDFALGKCVEVMTLNLAWSIICFSVDLRWQTSKNVWICVLLAAFSRENRGSWCPVDRPSSGSFSWEPGNDSCLAFTVSRQTLPKLGRFPALWLTFRDPQGQAEKGKAPWEGVRGLFIHF